MTRTTMLGPLAGPSIKPVCCGGRALLMTLAASGSIDWSAKDRTGREVRVALELHCRGDQPGSAASLIGAIESRIAALPAAQQGFQVVTSQFLRARAEQRGGNTRAILIEYRFRLLAD